MTQAAGVRDDIAALARGGRTNLFGFFLRLGIWTYGFAAEDRRLFSGSAGSKPTAV